MHLSVSQGSLVKEAKRFPCSGREDDVTSVSPPFETTASLPAPPLAPHDGFVQSTQGGVYSLESEV